MFINSVVHPLVLLSVADHHARSVPKSSEKKRVIGVLLGQDNGKTVNVANSFGIPFEEDERDSKAWFLDHNYIESMWEMFKKVNGAYPSYQAHLVLAEKERSSGTNDWVVSLWAQVAGIRPRDQRAVQALHPKTSHGHR